MPVVLPWPWRGRDRASTDRVTVVVVGHRRMALATAEKGKLLGSHAPMPCKAELGFVLNASRFLAAVKEHLDQAGSTRLVLVWTKPRDKTPASRLFVMGQVRSVLGLLSDQLGILLRDELLDEIRIDSMGLKNMVPISGLVASMRKTSPEMGEDEALAAAVAVLRTAPSPYRKKLNL